MHQRVAPARIDLPEDLAAWDRRRNPRVPVPYVIVAVERSVPNGDAPTETGDGETAPAWACSAIDICRDGLALALPASVAPGDELLLTFKLDEETCFSRIPGLVVRTQLGFGLGAVRFHGWTDSDLRTLEAFLASRGQLPGDPPTGHAVTGC